MDVRDKMHATENVLITKSEVSTPAATKSMLSLPVRKYFFIYLPSASKKNGTGMIKMIHILEAIDPDNANFYSINIFEMFLDDFASCYDCASE